MKGIDFHPVEPWILTTLYSGKFTGMCSIVNDHLLSNYRPCLHLVIRNSGMLFSSLVLL